MKDDGTHVAHCCAKHGCKYIGDWDSEKWCPVVEGVAEADGSCELCWYDRETGQDLMTVAEAAEIITEFVDADPDMQPDEREDLKAELAKLVQEIHDIVGP